MATCIACNTPIVRAGLLHRTKPKGTPDPGWMCEPCLEIEHPDLLKDIKERPAPGTDLLNSVKDAFQ